VCTLARASKRFGIGSEDVRRGDGVDVSLVLLLRARREARRSPGADRQQGLPGGSSYASYVDFGQIWRRPEFLTIAVWKHASN
jgi:hypothetical protein